MRLAGRLALITGGGGGLGRGVALGMAAEGASVAVADHDVSLARQVAEEIREAGGRAAHYPVDVTDSGSVDELVDAVARWADCVDVLVNSAGVGGSAPFLDMSEDEWDRVIDVNLKGTFLVSQRVARRMCRGGGGSIVNLSSVLAQVSRPDQAHYGASKGGVGQLTQAMALALAPHDIRVNAIAPGPCDTPLTVKAYAADPPRRAAALSRVALGRPGTPRDIAGAALYLASDEAAWVTGTTIYVDGGLLAAR
ncbi:SDR family NAD(P)-dependent oxidoreductase [Blastococcus saxobsidens]|uniref:3-oxoacyl-[acyl-carrier-protein] reductase n=1 Tax=Blastococcus saxobsidens (strain DD2) TaxID=1146883 RepID=H6RSZ0_BLASD|nr:SDR family NAD(P)-dependent oxidoreductase [Blastococcus saxobsidens]CCG04293.1 3-oxoacyl-[acyl-carrier-protein] reductase [Blastococcus saxobsidens DD2]